MEKHVLHSHESQELLKKQVRPRRYPMNIFLRMLRHSLKISKYDFLKNALMRQEVALSLEALSSYYSERMIRNEPVAGLIETLEYRTVSRYVNERLTFMSRRTVKLIILLAILPSNSLWDPERMAIKAEIPEHFENVQKLFSAPILRIGKVLSYLSMISEHHDNLAKLLVPYLTITDATITVDAGELEKKGYMQVLAILSYWLLPITAEVRNGIYNSLSAYQKLVFATSLQQTFNSLIYSASDEYVTQALDDRAVNWNVPMLTYHNSFIDRILDEFSPVVQRVLRLAPAIMPEDLSILEAALSEEDRFEWVRSKQDLRAAIEIIASCKSKLIRVGSSNQPAKAHGEMFVFNPWTISDDFLRCVYANKNPLLSYAIFPQLHNGDSSIYGLYDSGSQPLEIFNLDVATFFPFLRPTDGQPSEAEGRVLAARHAKLYQSLLSTHVRHHELYSGYYWLYDGAGLVSPLGWRNYLHQPKNSSTEFHKRTPFNLIANKGRYGLYFSLNASLISVEMSKLKDRTLFEDTALLKYPSRAITEAPFQFPFSMEFTKFLGFWDVRSDSELLGVLNAEKPLADSSVRMIEASDAFTGDLKVFQRLLDEGYSLKASGTGSATPISESNAERENVPSSPVGSDKSSNFDVIESQNSIAFQSSKSHEEQAVMGLKGRGQVRKLSDYEWPIEDGRKAARFDVEASVPDSSYSNRLPDPLREDSFLFDNDFYDDDSEHFPAMSFEVDSIRHYIPSPALPAIGNVSLMKRAVISGSCNSYSPSFALSLFTSVLLVLFILKFPSLCLRR